MGNCDVCNGYTTWETGTAYTADEFRSIVRLGFEPPPSIVMLGPAAVQGWKNGLVANSTTGWLLCSSCAQRAARILPKTAGGGPTGHVLTESMSTAALLGVSGHGLATVASQPAPALPAGPAPEILRSPNKNCPTCQQDIPAEATTCPQCQSRFAVTYTGYCCTERAVVAASAGGTCLKCGREVLDRAVVSTSLGADGSIPVDASAGSMPEPGREALIATVAAGAVATNDIPPVIPPAAPGLDSKKCPECGETIKLEAKVCRFCNARFVITEAGYCAHCHKIVTPDPNGKCPTCQGGLVDRRLSSTLAAAAAAPAPAQVAPAATYVPTFPPPAAAPAQPIRWWQLYLSPNGRIGRKTFFLKGLLPLFVCLLLVVMIAALIGGFGSEAGASQPFSDAGMAVFVPAFFIWFWGYLMLIVKRFHDLNRSGWNILLWILPFIGQFIYLINLIECFFVRGTDALNRFGPATDRGPHRKT